jgi:glycosyltransferase involved in cell wall biosynthesis
MRIALLASGEAIHSRRWAVGLAERGHQVRLYTLEDVPAGFSADGGISIVRLGSRGLPDFIRYPLASPELNRELERFDPGLIDAHFVPSYGLLGALSGRHPLVVNCWGSDLLVAGDPLRRARARWVLGRADRVFVDAGNLGEAARRLGVGHDRLRTIPWGVECERFVMSADAAARRRARQQWPGEWGHGGDPGDPVVVSTRVLHPIYDVATLIRAWPEVHCRHPRARLLVAGDGPELEGLRHLAGGGGSASSVVFLGRLPREQLPELLAGADVYVSTSLSDSTSVSLLEAMSAGCYPVISDIDGNREWVSEETAAFFGVGDVAALSVRLAGAIDVLGNEDVRRANRRKVESEADWRLTIDRVEAEYRELTGG